MINFFKRKPAFLVIVVAIMLIILIAVTQSNKKSLPAPADAAGSIITPVSDATGSVFTGVSNFFKNLFGISDAQKEVVVLKEQLQQAQSDVALVGEMQKKLDRFFEISNYVQENDQYEMVTVQVTAKNPGYWFDTVTINAGRNKGIKVDMPVVTPSGLVGRVIEVGQVWSKVLTLVDAKFSIPGVVERTRDNGIIRGMVELGTSNGFCQMYFLPLDSDLVPTDKILTSGLGGVFPKGIIIGEIVEISRQQEGIERTALIKPAVNFTKLEEVIIIKKVIEKVQP